MTTDPQTEPPKPIWQSKTAVVNSIIAISSLVPSIANWEAHHAWEMLVGIGILNVFLRYITKGRVIVFPDSAAK